MSAENYTPVGKTVSIKATSRASVKVGDSFFTMEYSEERVIPDLPDVDLAEERALLWDCVNNEVDAQVEDVVNFYNKK